MARTSLLLLTLFFALIVLGQAQQGSESLQQVTEAQQCRLDRLTTSRPVQRLVSEGGVMELYDVYEDQFQCAGVGPMRNTLRPGALSLPNYHPAPRLVYIEEGQGVLGISYPGCAESFQSSGSRQEEKAGRSMREQHQKIHRIKKGDIVALRSGVTHWCFNDGNEDLIAVSINDLNSEANQLDPRPRAFYFGGGLSRQQMAQQQRGEKQLCDAVNIFTPFDEKLLAEAFDVSVDTIRRMQKRDERGLIVNVEKGSMSMVKPDEGFEEEDRRRRQDKNGVEESFCNMRIRQYLDNPREADIYDRQGGSLNTVDVNKLPILRYMGMSAEKGELLPNAIFAPHFSMNAHTICYCTRGEARVQVVGQNGRALFDDTVRKGDMVVIPQFYAVVKKAGNNGFEWVSFKTSDQPMKSPLVGSTSVIKGMPLEVLTNAYRMSPREARDLKFNRQQDLMFFPPSRRSS